MCTPGEETLPLMRHTGWVLSVAFSPDGKRIVSGSGDQTVKVWNAQTGQEPLTLKGHTGWVLSVCFSPDGKRIVSGSGDQTMKVWIAQTGQQTLSFKGHTLRAIPLPALEQLPVFLAPFLKGYARWVTSVAFSSDGKCIVSGSGDQRVKVWDAQTGPEALKLDQARLLRLASPIRSGTRRRPGRPSRQRRRVPGKPKTGLPPRSTSSVSSSTSPKPRWPVWEDLLLCQRASSQEEASRQTCKAVLDRFVRDGDTAFPLVVACSAAPAGRRTLAAW